MNHEADLFRRDANVQPSPGSIIAEFKNGTDALAFRTLKGSGFTVTPGIHHVFAVRVACDHPVGQIHVNAAGRPVCGVCCQEIVGTTQSSASPVGCGDRSPSVGGQAPAEGGVQLRACTPRASLMVDSINRVLARLPHTGDTL